MAHGFSPAMSRGAGSEEPAYNDHAAISAQVSTAVNGQSPVVAHRDSLSGLRSSGASIAVTPGYEPDAVPERATPDADGIRQHYAAIQSLGRAGLTSSGVARGTRRAH